MQLPDYNGRSIVNLMSSIRKAFGNSSRQAAEYKELKLLPSRELKHAKNIALIVIDGLGFKYLKENARSTIFKKGMRGAITSVFPPTTASAITTFATGTAPQQHGFTGWFMHLKEIGVVSTILLFKPRIGGHAFSASSIKMQDVLKAKGFSKGLKASSYLITHKKIMNSCFTKATSEKSKILGYNSLKGFFAQIAKAIKSHNKRKYIYAYWLEFDSIAHEKGINSKEAKKHYKEICAEFSKFIKRIENTNTKLIITSDHGLIDTTKERLIRLEEHPELLSCLTLPLCGEPRIAYCYVHPSKSRKFETYVKTKLSKCCSLHKSQNLINKNFFGLYAPSPELLDRVGDYALIMKENYILKDKMPNEKDRFLIGNHGGVSKDEMLVPLIVFDMLQQ